MAWTIDLSEEAEGRLRDIPRKQRLQIVKAIGAMEQDPFAGNVKALQGEEWKGIYRKRTGRYRIIFKADRSSFHVGIAAILLRTEKTYR